MTIRKPLYRGADGTPTEMSLSDELPVGYLPELTALAVPATTVLTVVSPGEVIQFDGSVWRNTPLSMGNPGTGGVQTFFSASPTISATGAENILPVNTLTRVPVLTGELTVSVTVGVGASLPLAAWLHDTPIGSTTIPTGLWTATLFCGVDSVAEDRLTLVYRRMFEVIPEEMTLTTTGTGSSRTVTAASGAPFVTGDANADRMAASFLQTPKGLYPITGYTSPTVVTIAVPAGYGNESAVAWKKWRGLFVSTGTGATVTALSPTYMPFSWDSMQPAFTVAATSHLGAMDYAHALGGGPTTMTIVYDGDPDVNRNSRISSPMPVAGSGDLTALTTTQMASLTTATADAMTTAQLEGLASMVVKGLTTTQLAALTTTQVGALPADTRYQLATTAPTTTAMAAMGAAHVAALTTTALSGLTTTQIAAIVTDTRYQTTTAAASLTTTQMASLTSTQADSLSVASLNGLSSMVLRGLSTATVTVSPTNMSNNATPSPWVVTSSNETWGNYFAFNGITNVTTDGNSWLASLSGGEATLTLDAGAGNSIAASGVTLYPGINTGGGGDGLQINPKDFKIRGSQDNTNWTELLSTTGVTGWTTGVGKSYSFSTATAYRYLQLQATRRSDGATTGYIGIGEIQYTGLAVSLPHTAASSLVAGSPTGGNKGSGTINAHAVYDDGTILTTCYPIQLANTGEIRDEQWYPMSMVLPAVEAVVDPETGEVRVAAQPERIVGVGNPGLDKFKERLGTKYDPMVLEKFIAHWVDKGHLTAFPNREKVNENNRPSMGGWIGRGAETLDLMAIHMRQLLVRVMRLENNPPYPSWVLDERYCRWVAPYPQPVDGRYAWNEAQHVATGNGWAAVMDA